MGMNKEMLVKDLSNLIELERAVGALNTESVLCTVSATDRHRSEFTLNGLKNNNYMKCINNVKNSLGTLIRLENERIAKVIADDAL
jgi:hypothetical protein